MSGSNYTILSYRKFGEDLSAMKPNFTLQVQMGPFLKSVPVSVTWSELSCLFTMPWTETLTLDKGEVSYIKSYTSVERDREVHWYEILTTRAEVIKLLPVSTK